MSAEDKTTQATATDKAVTPAPTTVVVSEKTVAVDEPQSSDSPSEKKDEKKVGGDEDEKKESSTEDGEGQYSIHIHEGDGQAAEEIAAMGNAIAGALGLGPAPPELLALCAQGKHDVRRQYDLCGILCAFFCFPCGLLCLFCTSKKRCVRCGERP